MAVLVLAMTALIAVSSCGAGTGLAQSQAQASGQFGGNWQFTLSPPADNSFLGGLQGGFLLQNTNGALTGSVVYAISLPPAGSGTPTLCNSGSAAVTGTISAQTVT
ncbi:MAG: hypothetical protein WA824_12265, partial [Candidatus Sulfotelmatobacter sp.]